MRRKNKPVVRPCDRPKCFLARLKQYCLKLQNPCLLGESSLAFCKILLAPTGALFVIMCQKTYTRGFTVIPKFFLFHSAKCVLTVTLDHYGHYGITSLSLKGAEIWNIMLANENGLFFAVTANSLWPPPHPCCYATQSTKLNVTQTHNFIT